jgi:phosphatidylserine/phosphatidylglycerophosphate/cardiolipin synthase-like enzyme
MTDARELADAGVRVLLYRGAYFPAKTVCVDSKICSVGSANMDIRSFSINYETNLVVYDATTTKKLEADFERDMDSSAAAIIMQSSADGSFVGRLDLEVADTGTAAGVTDYGSDRRLIGLPVSRRGRV